MPVPISWQIAIINEMIRIPNSRLQSRNVCFQFVAAVPLGLRDRFRQYMAALLLIDMPQATMPRYKGPCVDHCANCEMLLRPSAPIPTSSGTDTINIPPAMA